MMRMVFWGTLFIVAMVSGSEVVGKPFAFKDPFGLAVNSRDVVYVAEIKGGRVSKFTPDGEPLGVIDEIEGYGRLVGPFDVHIGPKDWIYITDCFGHKVLVLDAEENLRFVLGTGIKSMGEGEFSEPHFVTVNQAGEIFVADTFNARIQKFGAGGKFLAAWGRIGQQPGEYLHNGYLARV